MLRRRLNARKSFEVLLVIAISAAIGGCRSARTVAERVEVPVYIHDTTRVVHVQRDSVMVERWRTEYQRGDTVFITNEVTRTETKRATDTVIRYVERPTVVKETEVVEVARPLRWWQKILIAIGAVAIIAAVMAAIFRKMR